jgi:hypothetical protein
MPIRYLSIAALVLVVGMASTSVGASEYLRKGELLGESGNWRVMSRKNEYTGKTVCGALYRKKDDIWLGSKELFISVRSQGGIDRYSVRFDDAPAGPMKPAHQIEREVKMIILYDVSRLLKSKRVRVQGVSKQGTVISEDLDLTGIDAAHKVLTGQKCK